jgi:uncharacterized protein YdiU (UPF0061 family)
MIAFDNSYARLPEAFYARVLPARFAAPRLIRLNHALAAQLGLDPEWLATPEGLEILAGQWIAPGAEPIAMVYAGHQFGHFVPQLGDGRAILLGEVIGCDGARRDLQLKGSGPTPYSRRGDGFAALGPVLREYLVSEAMAALGIPTTRALAAMATGEQVWRERSLPGAALLRVASSHIRVGTFQFFAARGQVEALRQLADHVIARHYPQAAAAAQPYLALLESVIAAQAELIAQWLLVGFIHGVMNTDNMSVAGETIDYGPCAFMDAYDPETVFSSIDEFGRYAYARQPAIAQWNLTRLAEALLPLLDEDRDEAVAQAKVVLDTFAERFNAAYLGGLRRKLGLGEEREGDNALAQDLLRRMAANKSDFTLTFRRLCDAAETPEADAAVAALFQNPQDFVEWAARWHARLALEEREAGDSGDAMRQVNPAFIPRNHLVEAAIAAAVSSGDFTPFETLLTVLANPYEDQPAHAAYAAAPPAGVGLYRTFCGT